MAKKPRLAFVFNPLAQSNSALSKKLSEHYNGVDPAVADILIPVGGDGSVLHALPLAAGRLVYGVVPTDSSSFAYTANAFQLGGNLWADIEASEKFPIHPLDVQVEYKNGKRENFSVFSSINIVRDNGQASVMDLTGNFNGASHTIRTMGDGLAFSTSMGSTGLAYSHGGPVISPAIPAIIFTGMGLREPRGLPPIMATGNESFLIHCGVGRGYRPTRIDIDGRTAVTSDDTSNPVVEIAVTLKPEPAAILGMKAGCFHPFKILNLG